MTTPTTDAAWSYRLRLAWERRKLATSETWLRLTQSWRRYMATEQPSTARGEIYSPGDGNNTPQQPCEKSSAATKLCCRIFGHVWFEKNSETDCCRRCGKCRRGQ